MDYNNIPYDKKSRFYYLIGYYEASTTEDDVQAVFDILYNLMASFGKEAENNAYFIFNKDYTSHDEKMDAIKDYFIYKLNINDL